MFNPGGFCSEGVVDSGLDCQVAQVKRHASSLDKIVAMVLITEGSSMLLQLWEGWMIR
jgi:hypothetical protein